jgi:hypothetical protein
VSILDILDRRFRVAASESPATKPDIRSLVDVSAIPIPMDYLDVVQHGTNIEIAVDGSSYIRVWGPLTCVELNREYEIQKYLPASLAVGDNEGGKALVIVGGEQRGLYLVDLGDIDIESATFVAPTLRELLVNGIGIDVVRE